VNFFLGEPAAGLSVIDRIFLEFAFAGLIANWAIERMIDQQKLEH
jgi:hypothetical protein